LAARRVVDVLGPKGLELSAIGTGHLRQIETLGDGIQAAQREVKALVELRVPFQITRQEIDDVERGARDSDWLPVKDAARKIAFAEDRSVFDGYAAAGIHGVRQGVSNPVVTLSSNVKSYPAAVARAVSQMRLAGVNGPYALLLGAEQYTAASAESDEGYPILQHIQHLVDGEIVWAPAVQGGFVVTTRGGDFELDIGQDISIGYLSHSQTMVELYFQEAFTFRMLTAEAAVVLVPGKK
jgi:uncharacterized linocin/CFP29 family protein